MSNISSSPTAVPSIHIHNAEDVSALFEGDLFPQEIYNAFNLISEDTGAHPCSRGLQSEYFPPNVPSHPSPELEDIPEFSHLTTTSQPYLTGPVYSLPHPTIMQDYGTTPPTDRGLSPIYPSSPVPSPANSFSSSLSPSSFFEMLAYSSDSETSLSPSPAVCDQFPWRHNHHSSDSLVLHPCIKGFSSHVLPSSLGPQTDGQRPRSSSSPSRPGPVASKAMLEANGRRRRHPAQHQCPDCGQTFTALFSLRRHAQSHTGERPFGCKIPGCDQRFFNSSDCKRHEKSRKRHKDLEMV